MVNWKVAIVATASIVLPAAPLWAAPLTYYFHGTVTSGTAKPYGLTIPALGAQPIVTGSFSYDPSAVATRTLTNGLGYEQQLANGLQATIGGVTISASDFEIDILNNVVQPDQSVKDEFVVYFSSGLSPPLGADLIVNGTDRSSGLFSIAFLGSSSISSDASLPSTFNYAAFQPGIGVFGSQPSGAVDTFIVTPEPSTVLLLVLGSVVLGIRLPSYRRKA